MVRSALAKLAVFLFSLLLLPSAHAGFASATKAADPAKCSAQGAFRDPRNGGECWSCPAGFVRNLNRVDGGNACTKPPSEDLAAATKTGNATWPGCPSGQFWDGIDGGGCWSCPSDKPRRTAYSVKDPRACATKNIIGEKLGSATKHGKPNGVCASGFLDLIDGGTCWTCPSGYTRTAYSVKDSKACTKWSAGSVAAATFSGKSGCATGAFLDIGLGQCWSCPASHPHRTINPVTGAKACTDKPIEIFAADINVCKAVVTALSKGSQGSEELSKIITPLLEPARKPIEKAMADIEAKLKAPAEIDALIAKATEKIDAPFLDELTRLNLGLNSMEAGLKNALLNPAICDASGATIEKTFTDLGFAPGGVPAKTSALTDFFFTSAHAATPEVFMSFGVLGSIVLPNFPVGMNVGYQVVTNYKGKGGIYMVLGPQVGTSNGIEMSLGMVKYPAVELSEFEGPVPGGSISIGQGPLVQKIFSKLKGAKYALPSSVDIEIDLDLTKPAPPGIGVSKGISASFGGTATSKVAKIFAVAPVTITGGVGWSIPLRKWGE